VSARAAARGPAVLTALLLLAATRASAEAGGLASYQYTLSSTTGVANSTWAGITYDRVNDETYVVADGLVRIYNRTGMEVFRFGRDEDLGFVNRVAVLTEGDLVVMSWLGKRLLTRCDFRGRPLQTIELQGLPATVPATFAPDTVEAVGDALYFVETSPGRVVVTDTSGAFRDYHDLRALAKLVKRSDGIGAVSVAADGKMLFTVPTLFAAFVLAPSGEVRQFGVKGSRPGRFNIVGKMVSDENGNLFLTDKLRSVVMVFDGDFRFLGEFGYRGPRPENMAAPFDLAVGNGKVFVAQARKLGVKVFKLSLPAPVPPGAAPPPPPAAPGAATPRPPAAAASSRP